MNTHNFFNTSELVLTIDKKSLSRHFFLEGIFPASINISSKLTIITSCKSILFRIICLVNEKKGFVLQLIYASVFFIILSHGCRLLGLIIFVLIGEDPVKICHSDVYAARGSPAGLHFLLGWIKKDYPWKSRLL